ncbi:phage coat protein [Luteimonas sp. M1R5S18]|uniref:Phage coat protein n=1 Tax=Luteimonas rhizosphaericola TaxID=3042024 RepID=A0ABT6JG99_9GAMM|nr:phage coat protein [Luteimonas rhizosphaericola]MDH5829713.1 phage coat protein [Luteimonas rhizosphaericola]
MQAGWLDDLTNWLRDTLGGLWDDFVEFMGDLLISALEALCDFFASLIESIPVPDFITQYSLDGLVSQLPPNVLWFLGVIRFPECIALLGLGVAFRLIRKLFTLGQW